VIHSLDVLKALLSSDLGSDILHLPLRYDGAIPQTQLCREMHYTECSPVSFLLSTKLSDLKDDIIVYLELLLNYGNVHNLHVFTLSFSLTNYLICRPTN